MMQRPTQPLAISALHGLHPVLIGLMGLLAFIAIVVPIWLVSTAPHIIVHSNTPVVLSKRVVPKQELPPVDPVKLQAVNPDDAREINAAIPFSTLPNPAARPFRIFGALDSRERAVDCLAAGVYYEAGDDAVGQRAVAQVIVNRVKHPAFPKTVCGVVFQGSERTTGCQFTFTCDGAMFRYRPSQAAWERARYVASVALNGSVYGNVGHATHYHTNWVVPYWSASLEKITAVDTHLFFRWTGWWGTPPAFNRAYTGVEPNVPQMSRLSPFHKGASNIPMDPLLQGDGTIVDPATIPDSAVPSAFGAGVDANSFVATLDRKMNPDAFAALAIKTCGERPYCKFMGWIDPRQAPAKLPATPPQMAAMSFSYLRDQSQGFAKALWNCQQFRRPSPIQCMRAQMPAVTPNTTPVPIAAPAVTSDLKTPDPVPLTGVRRKSEAAPARPPVTLALPVASPTPQRPN